MELLTINKPMSHQLESKLHEPITLIKELKKIVKELKAKNSTLNNYKLMDVGFITGANQKPSRMKLYFIKRSI